MTKRKILPKLVGFQLLLAIAFASLPFGAIHAQTPAIASKHYNISSNIGANGYDLVSYFNSKPTKGQNSFSAKYLGITYLFSSVANRDLFVKQPPKYLPEYGGWCAYAMGNSGEKVEVDPKTFKILNGKLYLFYNAYFNNTLKSWNKDEANLLKKANGNWAKTIKN